jgi:hypothetical protein
MNEKVQHELFESDAFRTFLEEDLEYVCSFSFTDLVIPEQTRVPIESLRGDKEHAEVKVRMVTGDMLETAK